MKPIPDDKTHCFKHAYTHRREEQCPYCCHENLRAKSNQPEKYQPTPMLLEARLAWLRDLGKAGLPYPGDLGLDAFADGFLDGFAAAAAQSATQRSDEVHVLDAMCIASGYQRWWINSGKLFFERDGKPGYTEVLLVEKVAPVASTASKEGQDG